MMKSTVKELSAYPHFFSDKISLMGLGPGFKLVSGIDSLVTICCAKIEKLEADKLSHVNFYPFMTIVIDEKCDKGSMKDSKYA